MKIISALTLILLLGACSKKSDTSPTSTSNTSTNTNTNPTTGCPSINLTSKIDVACGNSTGSITVAGTGGNGTLQYNINGGGFQNSGIFSGLAPGTYLLSVKDVTGCTNTLSVLINSQVSYDTSIKLILKNNCAISGCHVQGGQFPNLTDYANVKMEATIIKEFTTSKVMPPAGSGRSLSSTEIQLIKCWVDDGALNN